MRQYEVFKYINSYIEMIYAMKNYNLMNKKRLHSATISINLMVIK